MYNSENGKELRPAHFVPSMLPTHVSADESAPLWLDETTDKKFYVFFKKFLPEPLFHCLLSRAHRNSKVEFLRSQPVVFTDVGKFWMSPGQPYRLKLIKDTRMIEVTFSCSNGNGNETLRCVDASVFAWWMEFVKGISLL
ncbi:hypothetical protein OS493_038525 [Desmophyllum pertusum]|uniref:Uncharacterized protein n=1 Tax=Desmophyllum pertusum TaxID=174260 RepID=A0A9X0CHL2_9CNID|nr:hypothetical protein OS493_038525 [Desmophyllum pertusum]